MAELGKNGTRQHILSLLKGFHAMPVENPARPGTPDVECTLGWMELKYLERWPVRNGIVQCKHFTPQQKVWLKKRWRHNKGAWLILQVANEWLVFDGETAANHFGKEDKAWLIDNSLLYCQSKITSEELVECLTSQN
jgi:hypothetical protein